MPYCQECSASIPAGAGACPTCGAALVETPTSEAEGSARSTLDADRLSDELARSLAPRYELLRPLGEGGMGLVFLAREPALKRLVAVKLLAPNLAGNPAARSRFEREARAAAALSHPNVVRVYAVGETAVLKLPYIVMQYVEGSTLAHLMSERGRMSERESRRILGEVASALSAAHARELVHRDVKPSNVLIESDTHRAYVADFGVSAALSPAARAEQTRLTATGMMIGTPVYMSPEQASADEVGLQSDVYSLGILAYELLAGELPFAATTPMGWAAAHLRDTPTPVAKRRPDVSPEVALLVDRCLAKEPAARPSASEVARGMLPTIESEVQWPPPGLESLQGRARTWSRLALTVAAAGMVVVLLLAFPPESVFARGRWLDNFAVAVARDTGPAAQAARVGLQEADAQYFAWQGVLVLAALVGSAAALGLLATLQRSLRVALRGRISGWHWITLADLVADSDGRGGLILTGAREFASLDARTRHAILASRRIAISAEAFAALWVIAVLSTRVVVGLIAENPRRDMGPMVEPWIALATLIPALLGMAASVAARLSGRALLGPLARRREFVSETSEVANWYGALPGAAQPRPVSRMRARLAGGTSGVLLTVVGGLGLFASGVAVACALVAARATRWLGPEAAASLESVERLREEDRPGRTTSLLRPYLPAAEPASDSAVAEWFRALHGPRDYMELRRLMRAEFPVRGGAAGDLFPRAYGNRLGHDTLRAITLIAEHPRTLAFRRLARAGQLDLVTAYLDRPLADYRSFFELPWLGSEALDWAAEANAIAALGDVARRDLASAVARLGENAAVLLHLMNTPLPGAQFLERQLRRWVFGPLAQVESLRGNRARADSLRQATQTRSYRIGSLIALATDPRDLSRLRELLTDSRFQPGFRMQLLESAWLGFCANPLEVAFGPSRARRDSLIAIADWIRDVRHARELAELMDRGWGRELRADLAGVSRLVDRLSYTYAFCTEAFRYW